MRLQTIEAIKTNHLKQMGRSYHLVYAVRGLKAALINDNLIKLKIRRQFSVPIMSMILHTLVNQNCLRENKKKEGLAVLTSAGRAPASFLAFTSAPHSRSSLTLPTSPLSHAKCNGVFPATVQRSNDDQGDRWWQGKTKALICKSSGDYYYCGLRFGHFALPVALTRVACGETLMTLANADLKGGGWGGRGVEGFYHERIPTETPAIRSLPNHRHFLTIERYFLGGHLSRRNGLNAYSYHKTRCGQWNFPIFVGGRGGVGEQSSQQHTNGQS